MGTKVSVGKSVQDIREVRLTVTPLTNTLSKTKFPIRMRARQAIAVTRVTYFTAHTAGTGQNNVNVGLRIGDLDNMANEASLSDVALMAVENMICYARYSFGVTVDTGLVYCPPVVFEFPKPKIVAMEPIFLLNCGTAASIFIYDAVLQYYRVDLSDAEWMRYMQLYGRMEG